MTRILLMILDKYGMDMAHMSLTLFLFWKLFANHLKHIIDKIDSNIQETKCVKTEVISLKERVATIEGGLGRK